MKKGMIVAIASLIFLFFLLFALKTSTAADDIDINKIPQDNWVSFTYSASDFQNALKYETDAQRKTAYSIVNDYTKKYNVNFNLIKAIIQVESEWNFSIKPSTSDARGLMQLKTDPVNDIKQSKGICYDYCGGRAIDRNKLDDNLFGGICYLACQYYHDSRLDGCKSLNIALAAYKQGPSEVSNLCGEKSSAKCDFEKCYPQLSYDTKRYIWKVKNAYDSIVATKAQTANLKVVIDAGHGGKDPGSIGINNYQEKSITLAIALELRQILSAKGIEVRMTRTSDIFPSLSQRVKTANDWNADVFVSIHANSASKKDASGQCPSATGAEVYYYETSSKGKNIAGNVQSELVSSLKLNNRGTKGTKKLYVLRNTKMPAILVELGFICNKNDFSVLSNKKKEIAQAIANGILKDFS